MTKLKFSLKNVGLLTLAFSKSANCRFVLLKLANFKFAFLKLTPLKSKLLQFADGNITYYW